MGSEYDAIMEAYGSVMDIACEGDHVIDKAQREALSDTDFGLLVEEKGKVARKYPLRVPGDKNKTKELCAKAIQFFHFCKGPYRKVLAQNIARVMKEEGIVIKIDPKSQLLKYVKATDFPDGCVKDDTPPSDD